MKKAILTLVIAASAANANAQAKKNVIGAYGGGTAEITRVNGKNALGIGGYGGVLINQKLLIGAAGNNIFFKQTVNGRSEDFQFNSYGLYTEYSFMPARKLSAAVGLKGGIGWQENTVRTVTKNRRKDGDITFVVQPKLALNIRITGFMQVHAYGSYRITGNTESRYYSTKNYNGAAAGVALVFGSF